MTKPLPCPFCGAIPSIEPSDPRRDGNCWGVVECVNVECASKPSVGDGENVNDERGSDAYKEAAIVRWNKRVT